eukprot:GHVP01058085.1.p1 GENE.GHVP01058085.1~~GHVP01058085.1.p1  ORF type:complete len:455 (+),score=104.26 GHVP01058085.1:400-1764(+)
MDKNFKNPSFGNISKDNLRDLMNLRTKAVNEMIEFAEKHAPKISNIFFQDKLLENISHIEGNIFYHVSNGFGKMNYKPEFEAKSIYKRILEVIKSGNLIPFDDENEASDDKITTILKMLREEKVSFGNDIEDVFSFKTATAELLELEGRAFVRHVNDIDIYELGREQTKEMAYEIEMAKKDLDANTKNSNSNVSDIPPSAQSHTEESSEFQKSGLGSSSAADVTQKAELSSSSTASDTQKTGIGSSSTASMTQEAGLSSSSAADVTQKPELGSSSAAGVTHKPGLGSSSAADVTQKAELSSSSTASDTQKTGFGSSSTASMTQKAGLSSSSTASITQKLVAKNYNQKSKQNSDYQHKKKPKSVSFDVDKKSTLKNKKKKFNSKKNIKAKDTQKQEQADEDTIVREKAKFGKNAIFMIAASTICCLAGVVYQSYQAEKVPKNKKRASGVTKRRQE